MAGEIPTSQWVRERLGFEPDDVQQRLLDSTNKRVILNCTRQWGKSTVTAAKAVHFAYTRRRSLTLAVSPTARQSGEFVRKAEEFAGRLGMKVRGDGDNAMSLAFDNGARLIGLPGSEATIRGFSAVGLLLVDEAARVEDALYTAVRPMLAVSGGTLWLMSTPFGSRGFFYEAWTRGAENWERVRVTAMECPRIQKDLLEQDRRTMSDRDFQQEYMCEFGSATGYVFDRALIERAIRHDVEPLEIR